MRGAREEIFTLLRAQQGVLRRSDVPELARQLEWLVRSGALDEVLPGTYLEPGAAADPLQRMLAARRWAPDGVLRGRAAARVTFWRELEVGDVEYSIRTRQVERHGYHLDRRSVRPELFVDHHPWRYTVPALTTLDLCPTQGGDVIDVALRSRMATVAQLQDALQLTSNRPGNRQRLQLLIDSRSAPWSAAERLAHRVLRAGGVEGWTANHRVEVAGYCYFLDIAFVGARVAVEVDGRAFHDGARFETDRARHNELTAAGWTVLHVTWAMLQEPAMVVALVGQTLRTCTW